MSKVEGNGDDIFLRKSEDSIVKQSQFGEKRTQFLAKIGFVLGSFGFVFGNDFKT